MAPRKSPFQSVHIEGIADAAFNNAYLSASAVLDQMNGLLTSLRHIPLTIPVRMVSQFEETSGFGARVDPFTTAATPSIRAWTSSGPVGINGDFHGTWRRGLHAGDRGGYGNMVEIDHGFEIHTPATDICLIDLGAGGR